MLNKHLTHLTGFRHRLRSAGVSCVCGDVNFIGEITGREKDSLKLPPGSKSDNPVLITAAIVDFEPLGIPRAGLDIEADGMLYVISELKFAGPLVLFHCSAGVPA